jgi:hypothetical protein
MSMSIKKLNKTKVPIVKINKTLDKLAHKILFPEKLQAANDVLNKIALPKIKQKAV